MEDKKEEILRRRGTCYTFNDLKLYDREGIFKAMEEYAQSKLSLLKEENEKYFKALSKISEIRDSIVGYQAINWSAHIYPLVATLTEAGIEGMGWEKARELAKTQVVRINELEEENKRLMELLKGADKMYDAFSKTVNQLAKDGTAIEGFTESWAAIAWYGKLKLANEIESCLKDKQ